MKKFFCALGAVVTAATTLPTHAAAVVSNLSNADASSWDLGPATGLQSVAISFTTGSGSDWLINSATLNLQPSLDDPSVPDQAVGLTVTADNAGSPGTTLGSFVTGVPTIPGNNTWAAAGTINLAPNTTYWLVGDYPLEDVVFWAYTTDLTSTGDPGWSIGHDPLTLNGASWEVLFAATPVLFSLDATAIPEPNSISLLLLAGLPLLRRHRR